MANTSRKDRRQYLSHEEVRRTQSLGKEYYAYMGPKIDTLSRKNLFDFIIEEHKNAVTRANSFRDAKLRLLAGTEDYTTDLVELIFGSAN